MLNMYKAINILGLIIIVAAAVCALPRVAEAKVVTQTVEYEQGGVVLEGYLAYDEALSSLRPGVLIVHAWKGITDYERGRAQQLAELGYVAFCADIYGKGVRPADSQAAGEQAGKFRADRPLLRARAQAGLDTLKALPQVDPARVAAIGYCFGGGTVLELARSGAPLAGVASFHGNLDTPLPAPPGAVQCKVLVLHGADDPHVTADSVAAFAAEMRAAGADWQLVMYGGAVHSFSDPGAGDDPSKGAAYNAAADRRSWQAMLDFFDELFSTT